MPRYLPDVLPRNLADKEPLADLYHDLLVLRNALERSSPIPASDAELTRATLVAFARHLSYRHRRDLKSICRCKELEVAELLTSAEISSIREQPQVFQEALSSQEWEHLRRAVELLHSERVTTKCKGTIVVHKALRVPTSTGDAKEQVGEDPAEGTISLVPGAASSEDTPKQVMVPSVFSLLQFTVGKRRPIVDGADARSGRLIVTYPGKPRQLELWDKGTPLSTLQNYVHSALGNPVSSKIIVGSLFLHQQAVMNGASPSDTVRVHWTDMAKLIGNSAVRSNGAVDPDFRNHFYATLHILSVLRAVWVPDPFNLLNGEAEWLRSPIYQIVYEKGRGDETGVPEEIGYSFGSVFQAFMYGNGEITRCVAPLDLDLYFAWNSRNQADEQMLHLYYSQMFQIAMSNNPSGVFRHPVADVLDEAGLTLLNRKHAGEIYDRFLDATRKLQKAQIVGSFTVENVDASLHERIICVEPSEPVRRRIEQSLSSA